MKLNIPLDNEDRLEYGIIFAINKSTEFGHTCTDLEILKNYAAKILQVSNECIENAITRLVLKDKICLEKIDDEDCIYRSSYYYAEKNIADNIVSHTILAKK